MDPDNRRIFIWRERGTRSNPAFMHEKVIFSGEGVMAYADIAIGGSTYIHIIWDGAPAGH